MRSRSFVRCGVAALMAIGAPLQAQSLASRVAAVEDGAVTFHYAPRPGVCGDGEHFIRIGAVIVSRVVLEQAADGAVHLRARAGPSHARGWRRSSRRDVGGPLRSRDARDLGAVSAPEAARYLMTIAARGTSGASKKAIFPAVLADSATVWPALFEIARDTESRSRATRQDALFWLSRFASGAVAGRPNDPFADDEDGERKRRAQEARRLRSLAASAE